MIVSVTSFLIDFPEFKNVDRLFIERKLLAAERVTPYSIWRDDQREGIMLEAANRISMSPIGQQVRLSIENGDNTIQTTYENQRKDLARSLIMGLGKVI
jgi:hypothetical protein